MVLPRLPYWFAVASIILGLAAWMWPSLPASMTNAASESSSASFSLPGFIARELAQGKTYIKAPAGRYEVKPFNGRHLVLRDLKDVTIDGTGVEFICTETTLAIMIENCENLTLKGFTIDYDPLPFTQGRIVEISEDRKSHTIEIEEGFAPAEAATTFKHLIYTPAGDLRYGEYFNFEIEALPGNRLRISGLHPRKDGGEQLGDIVVISTRHLTGPYVPHAIHTTRSTGTVFEDVTIYSSPCFGFYESHSSRSTYRRCVIDRKPGRLHSLNADAFHSKFAEVGPQLIDCRAMWQGDDAINICGSYHLISAAEGAQLRVLAKRELDIEVGDRVQILDAEGRRMPEATVLSIEPAGKRTTEEEKQLEQTRVLAPVRKLLDEAYTITLDAELSLPFGSYIGSNNRLGNGFSIRGCEFGNNRSRGILVKASEGEIIGNRLINNHMQAIKIAPEHIWLESGYSQNVMISENEIINPGKQSIYIQSVGPHPIHRDIEIVDNEIATDFWPAIYIRGLENEHLEGNVIRRMDGAPIENPVVIE